MNAVSVISRAYDAEAPYIKSFIDYYSVIGCTEFHIVVPNGNPSGYLAEELRKYPHVRLYTDCAMSGMLRGAQNIPLKHITTSHLLSVDIDEYLDIRDIRPLLLYDYVQLNWAIVPYSSTHSATIPGFIDGQCKYIVRTSLCEYLDDHDCRVTGKVYKQVAEVNLLHYVYRSFYDLYLKCALSNYGEYPGYADFVNSTSDSTALPSKFKMAAAYKRIADASTTTFPNYCVIDHLLEDKIVKSNRSCVNVDRYYHRLLNYASRLDLVKLINLMMRHEKYRLYGRIPHHVLAEIADRALIDELHPDRWISRDRRMIVEQSPLAAKIARLAHACRW
jgi:hypothetical protein